MRGDGDNLELQRFSIDDDIGNNNGYDDQNEEQTPGEEETFTQKLHRRRCRYLPSFITKTFKGSLAIAFLSHACFITASLFYVKLSFVLLAWVQDETVNEHVPKEVLGEDDDIVWSDWASGNENGAAIQDMRENYYRQYKFLYVMGAFFFVLVGVLDLMRYCDVMNVFMILAGATGMAAGLASTSHEAAIWELVSVHLYLMEAYNLVTREHEYEGHVCFRLSDVCFLIGSILDVSRQFRR